MLQKSQVSVLLHYSVTTVNRNYSEWQCVLPSQLGTSMSLFLLILEDHMQYLVSCSVRI